MYTLLMEFVAALEHDEITIAVAAAIIASATAFTLLDFHIDGFCHDFRRQLLQFVVIQASRHVSRVQFDKFFVAEVEAIIAACTKRRVSVQAVMSPPSEESATSSMAMSMSMVVVSATMVTDAVTTGGSSEGSEFAQLSQFSQLANFSHFSVASIASVCVFSMFSIFPIFALPISGAMTMTMPVAIPIAVAVVMAGVARGRH